MSCGWQRSEIPGCKAEKLSYENEKNANNAAIIECDKIITAYGDPRVSNNGIFASLESCRSSLECAIEKTQTGVSGVGIDMSALEDYRSVLNDYKNQMMAEYEAAKNLKIKLQNENNKLDRKINKCGDCMESRWYCDKTGTTAV